ncbi:ABC transporter permease [Salinicoccus hispanicus]|uniref:ABC transporter permease n=1 Tax=Salinicoccus hispanicus TaxID=157225 RepID=A0A6N8U3K4_9STAP|nr:ABC transporter permease [Salinicoccus hispanicus]
MQQHGKGEICLKSNSSNGFISSIKNAVASQRFIAILALVAIYIFFAVSSESFRSTDTLVSIFDASYYIGFLAIGVTFVIITGGIDLSIGTVMMCAAIIGGVLFQMGLPIWLVLIAIIAIGGLFGLFNGILIAKFKLPPFIATLGTMMIAQGLGSIISNVQSVTFPLRGSDAGYYVNLFRLPNNFPVGIFVLIGFALLAALVLNKTKIGRYIFAIGSNREATRLSGVNVNRWETVAYIISGLFAGIAGIAYAATYTTILPGEGAGFELDAIAGVVIGGTSLSGGIGSILGTVIGVFIMSVLKVGLPYIDLQPHYQLFITGIVLIIAVYFDVRRRNKL